MLETKDMVLCCHDYGLMQKLSKVLVKEHDTKYSSKSVVEYCIMNNEPIDYTCLHKEFINYYTFYTLSDNRWDYYETARKPLPLGMGSTSNLFSPVIVSWENVECLLKGE